MINSKRRKAHVAIEITDKRKYVTFKMILEKLLYSLLIKVKLSNFFIFNDKRNLVIFLFNNSCKRKTFKLEKLENH